VTGPAFGTLLLAYNPTWFWLLCGVLGLVAAVLVLGTGRRRVAEEPIRIPEAQPEPQPKPTTVQT